MVQTNPEGWTNINTLTQPDTFVTQIKVSNATSTHLGEQLCKFFFLKSIHRSSGPDKSR